MSSRFHPSVSIGPEVPADAIAADAIIHPGCRLSGERLYIGPGSEIGREAPATLINCQLGAGVSFSGGFVEGAVLLDGASVGSGAHLRPGTLLEEHASIAHTVGLKQTILFPFVTLGSLINFCDVLMAGGSSANDHSEVGSSFIHFNFTPQGDKATPSLLGDIPRGVFVDQAPIFLGGQGGLVGPVRIEYGTILGAGCVHRKDVEEPGMLVMPAGLQEDLKREYPLTAYRDVGRKVQNNALYLVSLGALRAWYQAVRKPFLPTPLFDGAIALLDGAIAERCKQLNKFADKLDLSHAEHGMADHPQFAQACRALAEQVPTSMAAQALQWSLPAGGAKGGYIETIKALEAPAKQAGRVALAEWMAGHLEHTEIS